jgi:radical SAM protein with 4Fe4S-binding SPASM domain
MQEGVSRGLAAISTNPIGEALLNSDLERYFEIAKSAGVIDMILYTNAHKLTRDRSISLIKSGVTWINISIGATTKETYESMREYADFDKVVNNALGFIAAKKELGSELPMVRVSFVNTRQNADELEDFVAFWGDKADVVSVQNLVNYHKYTKNADRFSKDFSLEIEEDNDKTKAFCSQPFQRLLIRNNGDITPCCRFFGLNLVFGNAFADSVYEVYNGEAMKSFKQNLNTPNQTAVCRRCLEAMTEG